MCRRISGPRSKPNRVRQLTHTQRNGLPGVGKSAGIGLTEDEAASVLKTDGYNELPRQEGRSLVAIALRVVREPMMLLLLAAGLLYLGLGDAGEATILLLFASVSVIITVTQEARTEKVLEALRDLTSPRALVIRDGIRKRISGRETVRGDIIILEEGARVPADAVLLECHDLQVDESLLTGESIPVPKADQGCDVYSGGLVVRGKGVARVTATGARSRIGQIGASLNSLKDEPPRLLAETRRLVRVFGVGAAVICGAAVALYVLIRGDWLNGILAGIALAMSMLPEEFPVVLTVFTAMGAWRISRARVLTRNAAAIESRGGAARFLTDTTGPRPDNRMSVGPQQMPGGPRRNPRAHPTPPSEAFRQVAILGALASDRQPYDPMEIAFHRLNGAADDGRTAGWTLFCAYGLRPDLLAMTQVWKQADGGLSAAAKGAPEAITRLCRLDAVSRRQVLADADRMAGEGLRVLAIASAASLPSELPESHVDLPLVFMGLVGLADPLRSGVPDAVSDARAAGIRVVMITGDYPITASAIARQAGLDSGTVITGDTLRTMDDKTVAEAVRTTTVFARIMPEQKLRIVEALKAVGEIVAMTGDGVNDAPSLKAAHIGIAMGGRGTDVAREASSLVLLDDDFGAILKAIRLGRRIHDNLRKAMCFIIAVHVPVAGMALLPILFGLPVILGPIHIALLEMVIDPVCSLVFENEAEEATVMRRPPASPQAPLLSVPLLAWGVAQGLVVFALIAVPLLLSHGSAQAEQRGGAFLSLVLSLMVLTLVNRSFSASVLDALRRPNATFAAVAAVVAGGVCTAYLWLWARTALGFGALHGEDVAVTLALSLFGLVVLEGLKTAWRRPLSV